MSAPVITRLRGWPGVMAGLALAWLAVPVAAFGAQPIDFARDIRPIFNQHCVACHGGVKRAGGVSYIIRERALAEAKSGRVPIRPGDPAGSELIRRITSGDPEERMPPPEHAPELPEREIALLREWIRQGAEWKEHWAYVAPKAAPLPDVSDPQWCRQPLDRFVLARLDTEKLKPAAAAERLQWLRRVTFDLTGLPPKPAEARAFLSDDGADAFEKVVDRLLDSPAFGERWTALWVDLSRYADTQGYERDYGRIAWPYRDWLIRAFNADMPFDQFTIRQLGGDLLPDATLDDQLATTFHRNSQTNVEGGSDDEEFRVVALLDRVNTTWEVWQGVTFRCVQCHAHPYDPIDHPEFYRFAALFNTSRDWDLPNDQPLLRVPLDTGDFSRARELDRRAADLRAVERREAGEVATQAARTWQPLTPVKAASTKLTRLEIRTNGPVAEIATVGTVSHDSRFTLEFPVPPSLRRLTALRIEGLPKSPEAARLTPELGFVISHLRAVLVSPGATTTADEATEEAAATGAAKEEAKLETPATTPGRQEIQFAHVFGDESEPFQDPEASLNKDRFGWGALPRLDRPRHAVFVPAQPVEVPAGAILRLILAFEAAPNDQGTLVMNRGRFAVSEDDAWTQFVGRESFKSRRAALAAIARERGKIPSLTVPVMQEQDATLRRVTAQFIRGNWLDKGEVVAPGVPKLFSPFPTGAPSDRLAFARWLVAPENPLTARVAVNRFWEQLFGTGLVETLEDFGSSGTAPSHPELLDFLALRFQHELGWSVKKLLRELVLSATYRQDATVRPELRARDPRNRLLARGPRTRLTAEMVRDQSLAVAGLLSPKMHGPPVMPPQPEGIWRSAYNSARWVTSAGEDRHRRALYTFCKRTSGYPSFMTFDAPSREVCTVRRIPSNTPLQALVTMNDPAYVECAQALARRMATEVSGGPAAQLAHGWELVLLRRPDDADLASLLGLYERTRERFEREPATAAKLGDDPAQAALTVVANALLNLDAVLMK